MFDFATPLAGSPDESLSRVNIHELGFPAPELQVVFTDRGGRVGDVDFWWRMANLIGEFDGLVKYTRAEYTQGRPKMGQGVRLGPTRRHKVDELAHIADAVRGSALTRQRVRSGG